MFVFKIKLNYLKCSESLKDASGVHHYFQSNKKVSSSFIPDEEVKA